MADRSILYRLRAALQGSYVAVAREIELLGTYTGVLNGSSDSESALQRLDATGIGSSIFRFTGDFAAQNSNINDWFGGRQLTRLRCTSNNSQNTVTFTLPGATALNTAFDQLVAAGLDEIITLVVEYTGPSSAFLSIVPRTGGPNIQGSTSIPVRSGIAATVEITRSGGVLSSYVFDAIGAVSSTSGGVLDSIKLVNPASQVWDASTNGTLPTQVVKGNAYRVVNAPSDGSGRFNEPMSNGDWVVWEGESFNSWSTEPHAWFVLPAHDVRRISALENEFLNDVQVSGVSNRNTIVRGSNYADTADEIRLKIYNQRSDYNANDLNNNGDIDEYTEGSDITGYLGVRLTGTSTSLVDTLPTLYVFSEDSNSNFTLIGSLQRDFSHQGDFSGESDYLSLTPIAYTANDTIRVYTGVPVDRYNLPNLDINQDNLSDAVQSRISGAEPWANTASVLFSGATVRDVHVSDRIEYTEGYTKGIDWRDMTQSTTVNDNRYIDSSLSIVADHASFEISGFDGGLQKLIALGLQRNDSSTNTGALLELAPGVPFVRVNTNNNVQLNTTPGSGTDTWVSLNALGTDVTLGADNFLLFEMNPQAGITNSWEIVAAFYDGTTYHQCNDVYATVDPSVTGDHVGISRSTLQRGQVTRFSAIKSPGYLRHSELDNLIRNHSTDKWDFGFARLFEGSDSKDVVFQTELEIGTALILTAQPNNTRVKLVVDDTDTANIKLGVQTV